MPSDERGIQEWILLPPCASDLIVCANDIMDGQGCALQDATLRRPLHRCWRRCIKL